MANSGQLPAVIQDMLSRAGWHQAWSYDTTRFEKRLREEGFPVFDAAIECVRQFGGLVIQYPGPVLGASSPMTSCLGDITVPGAYAGRYDDDVGEPLCPIGTAESGNLDVWMSAAGRILLTHGYLILHGGNSPLEFLECLSTGGRFEPFE